jgi:hypothetical protein
VHTNDGTSSTGSTTPVPTTPDEAQQHLLAQNGWEQPAPDPALLTAHAGSHQNGAGGKPDQDHSPAGSSTGQTTALGRAWAYIPTSAAGIALMGLGLLLSWISVVTPVASGLHRIGLDTDDGRLIAFATVLLGLLLGREQRQPSRSHRALLLTITAGVAAILWFDWHDLLDRISGLDTELAAADVGPGLFLTAVGTGLLALGITLRAHMFAPGALAADIQRLLAQVWRRWVGLARWKQVVATAVTLIVLIGAPVASAIGSRQAAMKDADIGNCLRNDVTVEITNHSSRTADYSVTVKLLDPDDRELSRDTVKTLRVGAGLKRVVSVPRLDLSQPWKYCKIGSVTRTAS